jgi:hypothetical protein
VRKTYLLTVIMIKNSSLSIEDWSSFMMDEWANLRKSYLRVEICIGSWGVSTNFMKSTRNIAISKSFIIFMSKLHHYYIYPQVFLELSADSLVQISCGIPNLSTEILKANMIRILIRTAFWLIIIKVHKSNN